MTDKEQIRRDFRMALANDDVLGIERAIDDMMALMRCEGCDGHECDDECAYPGAVRRLL